MRGPTQNLGRLVLRFIGYRQTDKQTDRKTDKQSIDI